MNIITRLGELRIGKTDVELDTGRENVFDTITQIMRCVASAGQQFFDSVNGWYNVEACLAQAIERMCSE